MACHWKPPTMLLVPGRRSSQKTKMTVRSGALAYSGTEVVRMQETEITRSRRAPSRMPARTPKKSARGITKARTKPPSSAVLARRGQSTSETGTR